MEKIFDLIQVGLYEGFIWVPFVLGVGILYRYLKIIDISIEGVAVASGIMAVVSFNYSQSYFLSLLSAIITSIVVYTIVFFLIRKFQVHPILAGIILTLIIHSAAAIIIGESLVLQGSTLFSGVFSFSWLVFAVSILILLLTELFFRTHTGLKIRYAGREENQHNSLRNNALIFLAFVATAIIISTGSFIYVHKQGVARSGGGFEFLIVALGSFLITDKFLEFSVKKLVFRTKTSYNRKLFILISLLRSPVFKALTGSLVFQTIAIFVIFYTPNPSWWKLLFALILLPGAGILPAKAGRKLQRNFSSSEDGIRLKDICFSYQTDYINKQIFKGLNANFKRGINIIQGENGSGKTSLLKIIHSTLLPDSGEIIASESLHFPDSVFYLTQNPFDSLNQEMTVFENLCISLAEKNLYITRTNRLKYILDERLKAFNLPGLNKEDEQLMFQFARNLSGGQAQKVVLYMSVLKDPQVILADEPSSGMDTSNFQGLLQIMESFHKKGKLIIIVTHDVRLKNIPASHFELKDGHLNTC